LLLAQKQLQHKKTPSRQMKNKQALAREVGKHRFDLLFLKRWFRCCKLALTSTRSLQSEGTDHHHDDQSTTKLWSFLSQVQMPSCLPQSSLVRVMSWLSCVSWFNLLCVVLLFCFCLAEVYVGNEVMKAASKFTSAIVDGCLNQSREATRKFILVMLLTVAWILGVNALKTVRMLINDALLVGWRKNLTLHLQSRYLNKDSFYQMLLLDKRVDNPDQRVTRDVEAFSKAMGTILEKLFQSPTNVITYTVLTYKSLGWQGPLFCYAYFALGSIINKFLISPIANLWYRQEIAEGNFRFSHVSLRTNAESIAFFGGEERERERNEKFFAKVIRNRWFIVKRNFFLNFHTNLFGYIGSILNLFIIAFATFVLQTYGRDNETPGELMARIQMDSFGVIMLVYGFTQFIQLAGDLSELAGYTARIGHMTEVLAELKQREASRNADNTVGYQELFNVLDENDADYIEFRGVSVYTPMSDQQNDASDVFNSDSRCLVNDLTFKVSPGEHLLIQGPSGAGKSSILRLLGNLWPYKTGFIARPSKDNLLFVPQVPYTFRGSLMDQITYPRKIRDPEEKEMIRPQLVETLQKSRLEYLLNRVNNDWEISYDWPEALSPGEKQRLSLARVFYRQPRFVILDESTSAVDIDVEEFMYKNIRALPGVTIVSVGHRPTLQQFHDFSLLIDGHGGWVFGRITKDL